MDNLSEQQVQLVMPNNIVYIEFLDKKNFPPGDWMAEPDYCEWDAYGFNCLVLRDMKLGMWRGFISLPIGHKFYGYTLTKILNQDWGLELEVHGGLSIAGKLPIKYKELNKDKWWLGFECSKGEDLLPLVKFDKDDPIYQGIRDHQSYKGFHFVRKETNHLAKQLLRASR